MPPYFFRYSQEDIQEYYLQFAAAVGPEARIFIYNIPVFTNEIAIETATALLGLRRKSWPSNETTTTGTPRSIRYAAQR